MTVSRQLEMVARQHREADLDEIIEILGLGPYLTSPCKEIAYGTQRSVDLALALIGRPSVVLLDDQLVQSDPIRLEWFRQALRSSVRDQQHQVIVITCRTGDYLTRDELPVPSESQHESDGGLLLSTDLEKLIRRVDRP